jgi:uncharacterized phiE125 gp8 family phage protein
MRIALVTPPALEPVSLAEAKLYLRVGHDEDDTLIEAMTSAARELCEAHVSRSFIATTFDLYFDAWPGSNYNIHQSVYTWEDRIIRIPRDVASVVEVAYLDAAGVSQTLDPSLYIVSTGAPGRISPAYGVSHPLGQAWPFTRQQIDAVRIRFVAGYGETADQVPKAVWQAILLTLGHLYENRGEESLELPAAAKALLASCDWGSYA